MSMNKPGLRFGDVSGKSDLPRVHPSPWTDRTPRALISGIIYFDTLAQIYLTL